MKDVLSVSEGRVQPQDSIALLRIINVPARGIGKGTVDQVEQYALQNGLSVWHAIARMLEKGGRFQHELVGFEVVCAAAD